MDNQVKKDIKAKVVPMLGPFIMVTFLFSLWGFANDITNPMVAAFKNILLISNFESSLVQFAFYGGYCVMAFPAALFIKRFSYKAGILVGLTLYAAGCLLFIPSGGMMAFWAFLISYFILTSGLSFLETSANPYILAMGPEETSTRRLNFAQAFNPMGSILGMFVASQIILVSINPVSEGGRRHLDAVAKGVTHHQQIFNDSIKAIDDASVKLATITSGKVSEKLVSDLGEDIQSAMNQMLCVDPEQGPKANQFRDEYHAALENAPRLLYTIRSNFSKDPESEAAIEAMNKQKTLLKENYKGGKAQLDIAVQTYTEAQAVMTFAPEVIAEMAPIAVAAEKTLKEAKDKVDSFAQSMKEAGKTVDTKVLADELKPLFEQSKKMINDASTKFNMIPQEKQKELQTIASARLLEIRKVDLGVITGPYAVLGVVVFAVLIIFFITKLPSAQGEDDKSLHVGPTLERLARNARYIEGVVAQAFYVGAQIMCWTFIIQYGENELDMEKATAQNWNILAMAIFVSSRFICTYLLKFVSPGGLLGVLALGGLALVAGTIFFHGEEYKWYGLYCLVGVSACMSLMFPTIYGIALEGLGDDAKLGAAGLIFAIGGGCLMPPMQGWIMDMDAFNLGFMELSSTRMSFILPLICFIVIAWYGFRTSMIHHKDR